MNESELLERAYEPPALYIFEEVEIGGGYHTLLVASGPEQDWSEPYRKSSNVQYRSRIVRVPYPPAHTKRHLADCACGRCMGWTAEPHPQPCGCQTCTGAST
jgi:hypothetical protein